MSTFRLASLLRLRQTQERLAAGDLARANAVAREASRLQRTVHAQLGAHELPSGDDGWAGAVFARAALRASLVDAQAEAELAAERTTAAQQDWQAARVRTRALERLAERHAQEESRLRLKADQQLLDDVGGRRSGDPTGQPGGSE